MDKRVGIDRRRRRTAYFAALGAAGVAVVFASLCWSTFDIGNVGRASNGRALVNEFALVLIAMLALFGIARYLIATDGRIRR